jgi:FixJ family two-component response regulator
MHYPTREQVIAIVDDDKSIREATESLLRGFGFQVELFSSAEHFLGALDLHRLDCLVLDIQMAGINGLKLQYQLAARDHAIPIIFLTAHGDKRNEQKALDRGAIAFLRKPFSARELLQALSAALKIPPVDE